MELKDSVFWSENPKFQKIWEDQTYFPYLLKNLESINHQLIAKGIKKVVVFDELGLNWEDWDRKDVLTLAIMPICNMIDQNGTKITEWLRANSIHVRDKFMPIDINTEENLARYELVSWFKTRNIVIFHVNPFLDDGYILMRSMNELTQLSVKFMTQSEIWEIQLTEQWQLNLSDRARRLERDIIAQEENAQRDREAYMECVRIITEARIQIEGFKAGESGVKEKIKTELAEIQKMPFVKRLLVRDKIYINFGDISITARVVTGQDHGKPILEQKRVFIGEIEFVIGAGEISVVNKKQLPGCNPHPHVSTEGQICFGQADLEGGRYLQSLELVKLIKLLYAWVYSYNENDAYQKISYFYKADLERVKITQEGMQRAIAGQAIDPEVDDESDESDEDYDSDESATQGDHDEQEL